MTQNASQTKGETMAHWELSTAQQTERDVSELEKFISGAPRSYSTYIASSALIRLTEDNQRLRRALARA